MLASPKMNRISMWVLFLLLFRFFHTTNSVEELVRESLINFYQKLSNSNSPPDPAFGWNLTSDPCEDHWKGVICNNRTLSVKRIQLNGLNFSGTFDASTLCNLSSLAASLTTISLNDNSLHGDNLEEISKCKQLTRFYIGNNMFSGNLPDSLSRLNNLKGFNVSWNNFNGIVPDMSRISGLQEFLVQNNQLTGPIPNFDLLNFVQFNVSFNNFTGPIPSGGSKFPASSFIGNPDLCGEPLSKQCPPSDDDSRKKSNSISRDKALMFIGYFLIVFTLFVIIIVKVCKKRKTKQERVDLVNKRASVDESYFNKTSANSEENKTSENKSKILEASADSGVVSSSLTVLTSPEVNGLKFDDLLRAPAELLGRGKHGTMYKVICEKGMILAVKRIRDWGISSHDFKQRMRRLDQVKHPNVLPSIAFYCSKLEKLLVYEYQQNGSLFKLLHGTQTSQAFDWSSRLDTAATISKALAFMHQELLPDHIAHGNLKSSNILLNNNMEPCITEYGLMVMDNIEAQPPTLATSINSVFKVDIYGLGVILLELLTGKMAQNNGLDLAKWVLSVVREEWTVEVFDKRLIREGASEERMVNLLQIAVKCVDRSPEARPNINQVVVMINTIKEEEERSMVSEP